MENTTQAKPVDDPKVAAAVASILLDPAADDAEQQPVSGKNTASHEQTEANVIVDALTRVAAGATTAPAEEESSTTTLGLPPTLDYIENVKDTVNGSAFEIQLYADGCLDCKHLVPSAEESFDDCHFSQGNRYCPAGWHRIVFVGHRMRMVERVRKAQAKKDTNRLLRVLSDLEKESLEDKIYVLTAVGLMPS